MTNFEKAVALDNEKWLASLPEEAPEYKFSEKYNKFRIKLFDKMRGEKYHRFTKRATIAIIVAAILLSMTIVTLAATLGKDFIIKHFDGFASVEVENGKEEAVSVNDFVLGYIPNGFEKVEETKESVWISFTYSKNDEWFVITKSKMDSNMYSDEEQNDLEKIEFNGVTYLYSHSDESNGFIWNDGKFLFDASGNIEKNELFKIVTNAK